MILVSIGGTVLLPLTTVLDVDPRPLYHVALASDWEGAQAAGRYAVSTRGRSLEDEGFVHCSFPEQVEATANRFYDDVDDVVLLRIDLDRLSCPVVVEDLVGSGEAFPHVYGAIDLDAVIEARPWPLPRDGSRSFAHVSPRT